MPLQRSFPITLLIAVVCVLGAWVTAAILGGIVAGFGVPIRAAPEWVGELFGISILVAWIGTFKLLVFNPRPRPWKALAWWTLGAFVGPILIRVAASSLP